MSDRDDYDVFLDTWEPSDLLKFATLPANLSDPYGQARLMNDSTGAAGVARTAYTPGIKQMGSEEERLRTYQFLVDNQERWSTYFEDQLITWGMEQGKVEGFVSNFAKLWTDGPSRRQQSNEMMGVKAAIAAHDRKYHAASSERFVINKITAPYGTALSADDMALIFKANQELIESFIPDYLDHRDSGRAGSINDLYVRRGVMMPAVTECREELHYLSSYSLALGPVEQFAALWTHATKGSGIPCIYSAPLPAVQQRVVAFAPFIKGMDLSQLEIVIAPPIARVQLLDHGHHGGIREFSFA